MLAIVWAKLTTIQSSAVQCPVTAKHHLESSELGQSPPKEGLFDVGHTELRSAVSTLCWPPPELHQPELQSEAANSNSVPLEEDHCHVGYKQCPSKESRCDVGHIQSDAVQCPLYGDHSQSHNWRPL